MTGSALLERTLRSIPPPDDAAAAKVARLLDAKTKPPGSLGRLEDVACRLAAIRGEVPRAPLAPAIVVAAADHGVAAQGVSAYPQEVTAQMLANFAGGGAAICVLAREPARGSSSSTPARSTRRRSPGCAPRSWTRHAGRRPDARAGDVALDGGRCCRTRDRARRGARRRPHRDRRGRRDGDRQHVERERARRRAARGGPGPGVRIRDRTRRRGRRSQGPRRPPRARGERAPRRDADPIDVLAAVGGLEVAFLVGVCLGSAARRVPVMLDGFITGAAALVANRLQPRSTASAIAATRSPEPGHVLVLEALGLEPLLHLRLRLGEGTGAALALPLVRSALAIVTDMATFDAAGVSGRADADVELPVVADA